jgi:RNA polymerase sigma factor (sigma-70 family)
MDDVPAHDAADLTQDVLLTAYTELKQQRGSLRGWLRAITRNRVKDWRRWATHRPQEGVGGTSHQLRLLNIGVHDALSASQPLRPELALLGEATERVRARCGKRTWQVFTYYMREGFTAEETAQEFHVSLGYVHQVRARVLRRYREELEHFLPSAGPAIT